jgi:hypothetical protein
MNGEAKPLAEFWTLVCWKKEPTFSFYENGSYVMAGFWWPLTTSVDSVKLLDLAERRSLVGERKTNLLLFDIINTWMLVSSVIVYLLASPWWPDLTFFPKGHLPWLARGATGFETPSVMNKWWSRPPSNNVQEKVSRIKVKSNSPIYNVHKSSNHFKATWFIP